MARTTGKLLGQALKTVGKGGLKLGILGGAVYGLAKLTGADDAAWWQNLSDKVQDGWENLTGEEQQKVEAQLNELDDTEKLESNPAAFIENHILQQMATEIKQHTGSFKLDHFDVDIAKDEDGEVLYYKKGDLDGQAVKESDIQDNELDQYEVGYEFRYIDPNTGEHLTVTEDGEEKVRTWQMGVSFSEQAIQELQQAKDGKGDKSWLGSKVDNLMGAGMDKFDGMAEWIEKQTSLNSFGSQLLAGALTASGLNFITGSFTGGNMTLLKGVGFGVAAYLVLRELEWTKDFIKGLGLEDSATSAGMEQKVQELYDKITELQDKFDNHREIAMERYTKQALVDLGKQSPEREELNKLYTEWNEAREALNLVRSKRAEMISQIPDGTKADYNALATAIPIKQDSDGVPELDGDGKLQVDYDALKQYVTLNGGAEAATELEAVQRLVALHGGGLSAGVDRLLESGQPEVVGQMLVMMASSSDEMIANMERRVEGMAQALENKLIRVSPEYREHLNSSSTALQAKIEQLQSLAEVADKEAAMLLIEEMGRQTGLSDAQVAYQKREYTMRLYEAEMAEAARIPTTHELVEDFHKLEALVDNLANKYDPMFVMKGGATLKYDIETGEMREGERLKLSDFNETQADYLEARAMLIHLVQHEQAVAEYEQLRPKARMEMGLTSPEFEAFELRGGGLITTAEGAQEQVNRMLNGFADGDVKEQYRLSDPSLGLLEIAERRDRLITLMESGAVDKGDMARGDERRFYKQAKKGFEQDADIDARYWREVPVFINSTLVNINPEDIGLYNIVYNREMSAEVTQGVPDELPTVGFPKQAAEDLQQRASNSMGR